jgi:hypothetical protein
MMNTGYASFVTLGLLAGVTVSIVHMENEYEIRIISFRKATKREAQIFFNVDWSHSRRSLQFRFGWMEMSLSDLRRRGLGYQTRINTVLRAFRDAFV